MRGKRDVPRRSKPEAVRLYARLSGVLDSRVYVKPIDDTVSVSEYTSFRFESSKASLAAVHACVPCPRSQRHLRIFEKLSKLKYMTS